MLQEEPEAKEGVSRLIGHQLLILMYSKTKIMLWNKKMIFIVDFIKIIILF